MRAVLPKKLAPFLPFSAAIAILFATIGPAIGALHSHHHAPAASPTCDDGGTHFAHHPDAPDLTHAENCLVCSVRLTSLAILDVAAGHHELPAAAPLLTHGVAEWGAGLSLACSRAPPLI